MLMSAMVKLDVHSFRNRFLWEILGNAQYLTSSQGHCVIPSNISFWSKRRSQLSQRVNLERAQGRETQMGKSSERQMKEAMEISARRQGSSELQYLFYQRWQPNSTFLHWWEKQRKNMKQGENWISGVLMYINFHAGKKMEEGKEVIVIAKKNCFIGVSCLAIQ